MRKPIIGVTPSVDEEKHRCVVQPGYLESIDRAGGLPLMLPLTDREEDIAQILDLCDGFLFVGGPDIEPWRYGQELLPECGPQNVRRDAMEWKLMEAALVADKPILGVCRGIQVLNTVLGGTLYQDIPSQYETDLSHSMPEPPYNRITHPFRVVEGTPLATLSLSEGINSRHHQAILDPAPGLEIMAYASDGIIEAVRMPEKRFVWAVQWHPEAFWEEEGIHIELFRQLIHAADRIGG